MHMPPASTVRPLTLPVDPSSASAVWPCRARRRRVSGALCVLLGLLSGILTLPAWAGIDEAQAAYDRGDYARAAQEWVPLAQAGHAQAQYTLGWMYDQGLGVPQDYVQAMTWYRRAADQGVARAQANLALMYDQGLGVPQDYVQAMTWYRRAADQGLANPQNNLGAIYEHGR